MPSVQRGTVTRYPYPDLLGRIAAFMRIRVGAPRFELGTSSPPDLADGSPGVARCPHPA